MVCLSTDKAVYPVNAMGMSKAMMEKVAQAMARTLKSFLKEDLGDNAEAWSQHYARISGQEERKNAELIEHTGATGGDRFGRAGGCDAAVAAAGNRQDGAACRRHARDAK